MRQDDVDGVDDLEEPVAPNGKMPKLTIGQRILTALPNLDRQRPAANRAATRSTGNRVPARPATARPRKPEPDMEVEDEDATSEEPIEPDEVISPRDGDSTRGGATDRRPAGAARITSERRATTGAGARRTDAMADMTNEELQHAIKRIDDRERKYALLAGPVGALFGILETIVAIHYNPPLHHKGHVANSVTVIYGVARVVLGGLVILTAYSRRRSLVAFALLFLGTAMGFPFALIFWGLGGWMIWRVFRYQKELTARGAGPQRGRAAQSRTGQNGSGQSRTGSSSVRSRPSAAARGGASDARERARARRDARDIRRGRKVVPAGPPPTKRYTPKKPTRPRPPAPSE